MGWRSLFERPENKLPDVLMLTPLPQNILSRPDIDRRYENVLGRLKDGLIAQREEYSDSDAIVDNARRHLDDDDVHYATAYASFKFGRISLEDFAAQRQSIVNASREQIIAVLTPQAQQALEGPANKSNRRLRTYVREFIDIGKQNLIDIETSVEYEIGKEFPGYQRSRAGRKK